MSTENLGQQFDGMLPGIDWGQYREYVATRSALADPPTPRKTTRETARVALPGLEKVNQFYGEEQNNQLASQLDVFRKNAARHPLPEGYSIRHSTTTNSDDGSTRHVIELHKDLPKDEGYLHSTEEVGKLSWNGDTGRVGWFGIDNPHNLYASHMFVEAYKIAAQTGSVGPTHSDDLSGDSYRMMKRHASAFLPSNAIVHGYTIDEHEARLEEERQHREYMRQSSLAQQMGLS